MFSQEAPRNATEAAAARHGGLELLLHVFFLNRGVLPTPLHNMVLMSPATSEEDVARYSAVFREFVAWLIGRGAIGQG